MLSGAMLLRHIGEAEAAARLEAAIADVTREGRTLTYDLAVTLSLPGRRRWRTRWWSGLR